MVKEEKWNPSTKKTFVELDLAVTWINFKRPPKNPDKEMLVAEYEHFTRRLINVILIKHAW